MHSRHRVGFVHSPAIGRCKRVLIFRGCEEVLGESGLRTGRYLADPYMAADSGGPEQESAKPEDRNGKEDIHAQYEG